MNAWNVDVISSKQQKIQLVSARRLQSIFQRVWMSALNFQLSQFILDDEFATASNAAHPIINLIEFK